MLGGLGFGRFVGLFFDLLAVFEGGSGLDEGDQVWGVDGAPPCLGGFDEFIGHGQASSTGAGVFGDFGS